MLCRQVCCWLSGECRRRESYVLGSLLKVTQVSEGPSWISPCFYFNGITSLLVNNPWFFILNLYPKFHSMGCSPGWSSEVWQFGPLTGTWTMPSCVCSQCLNVQGPTAAVTHLWALASLLLFIPLSLIVHIFWLETQSLFAIRTQVRLVPCWDDHIALRRKHP